MFFVRAICIPSVSLFPSFACFPLAMHPLPARFYNPLTPSLVQRLAIVIVVHRQKIGRRIFFCPEKPAPDFEKKCLFCLDRGRARGRPAARGDFSALLRDLETMSIDGTLNLSIAAAHICAPFVWCVCFECGWCTVDFGRIGPQFRAAPGPTCKYLCRHYHPLPQLGMFLYRLLCCGYYLRILPINNHANARIL